MVLKKRALLVLTVFLLIAIVLAGCNPTPKEGEEKTTPETVRLTLSAGSASAALSAWGIGISQIVGNNVPGYYLTVVEVTGSVGNLKEVKNGTIDFGTSIVADNAYEMYKGIGAFEGEPWPEVRLMWLREKSWLGWYVRADSGIKVFSDLAGKKFSPGVTGSAAALLVERAIDSTGVNVEPWYGAYGDAITDLADKRIVGVCKSSPMNGMPSDLLEAHFSNPLTMIGFTEEEAKEIKKKYPTTLIEFYPAGTNKELPEVGDFWGSPIYSGAVGSTGMSEEVVYQMTKQIYEHWKDLADAYPPCGATDPILDLVKGIPEDIAVPFHAGVVRYAKEIGMEIPDYMIPPEYSGL